MHIIACMRPLPIPKHLTLRMKLKRAVEHADSICFNYEDTIECEAAWERAKVLQAEFNAANDGLHGGFASPIHLAPTHRKPTDFAQHPE